MTTAAVDFWMDFGCPWSRISLVELNRASSETGQPINVVFHPLRLDPDAPADYGHTTIENLCAHLNIDEKRAEEMLAEVVEAGERAGLAFNFRTARGGNSFDAHRLLRVARQHGREMEVALELFRAHFEQGLLISDHDVLKEIGQDAGLPAREISELLSTDNFAAEVLAYEADAAHRGIARTPHFIINGSAEFSGVQWCEDFRNHLSLGQTS